MIPENLQILLDGDVIRYEIGYAAETGWQTENEIPPFEYVEQLLLSRIENIKAVCNTSLEPIIYISEGRCFRDKIARTKPYKGTRKGEKPWHYDNLTVYLRDVLGARVVRDIEADDQLAIDHIRGEHRTILVSRDKDLRQVPGWFYSWELGAQPSYGPVLITSAGHLSMDERGKLKGSGIAFFYSQCLTGDTVDNVPGLRGYGPGKAYALLADKSPKRQLEAVIGEYRKRFKHSWRRNLLEQGRLLWMTRRMVKGYPELWKITMGLADA